MQPTAPGIISFLTACALFCDFAAAQPANEPIIAGSASLYSALPAGEWASVESSVDRGLAWLASVQADDGSFPGDNIAQPATTALAVMAFLSRGHMPQEKKYGPHITKAIDYVLSTQRRRGYFSLLPLSAPTGHLTPSQTMTYNHAIAGLMLGEVYGMTSGDRTEKIETALRQALFYHREVQEWEKAHPSDFGGFRYSYPESPMAASDMSVTGWALMFYRSARNAEFNVPKHYFDEGLDFVERCYVRETVYHDNGIFRYRPLESAPGSNPQITLANTASAMLTLILGGRHEHESIAVGIDWFRSRPYPRLGENNYFYLSSYYSSQAMAQVGGEPWNIVYRQIAQNLLQEQTDEGAWPPGSRNEQRFGACYSTSLAVLALTPAYQLLPIYQR